MEELDFGDLENLDRTPFKLIGIVQMLLMGGINHRPKVQYTYSQIDEILEDTLENGDVVELLEYLIGELEKSSFFKNLQRTPSKKKK